MQSIRKALRANIRQYTMGIALAVLIIILEAVTDGIMLKPLNVSNLIHQNMYVFILGMGMLLCILTGGNIDLSVGSVVCFSGAICGVLMVDYKWGTLPTVLLMLLVGLCVGAWHGTWIAVVGVHPWITTLSGEHELHSVEDILSRDPLETLQEAFAIKHNTPMSDHQQQMLRDIINTITSQSNEQ